MRKYLIAIVLLNLVGCVSEPKFTPETVVTRTVEKDNWKEALVISILSNTPELNSHQMNGENNNKVFIHEDGREAVFDENGNLVKTPENKGSYNYYHPVKRPVAHYMADTRPWLILGNARDDPTTKQQRLEAYSKDLAIGIFMAFEKKEEISSTLELRYSSPEEYEETQKWINAFESANSLNVFERFEKGITVSEQEALEISKSIINKLP